MFEKKKKYWEGEGFYHVSRPTVNCSMVYNTIMFNFIIAEIGQLVKRQIN